MVFVMLTRVGVLQQEVLYFWLLCVSWSPKRQSTISRSNSEAKYRAMVVATTELTWITFIVRDFAVRLHQPSQLFSNDLSALYMMVNPIFHPRSKHIVIDYHFI